jgi:hypothetical protein
MLKKFKITQVGGDDFYSVTKGISNGKGGKRDTAL